MQIIPVKFQVPRIKSEHIGRMENSHDEFQVCKISIFLIPTQKLLNYHINIFGLKRKISYIFPFEVDIYAVNLALFNQT